MVERSLWEREVVSSNLTTPTNIGGIMSKLIQHAIALLALVSMLFGGYFYVDSRYALAGDVKNLSERLENKIIEDKLSNIQQRIWKIDDRYEEKIMPDSVKEEYRQLIEDKTDLLNKLKATDK